MDSVFSSFKPCVLLFLLGAILYIPGFTSLPPVDRDEARFAQATKQMLETNDFVRIRFQNAPRNKKPIGIYWLQAAAVKLCPGAAASDIWPYRIPSIFGAIIAVFLTYALGIILFDRKTALLGAVLLESSLLLVVEAHLAKTDAFLLTCIVTAQGMLAYIYLQNRAGQPARWPPAILFWVAQALGILIKGPVVPLVSMLTVVGLFILDRDLSYLKKTRPLVGIPLMLALVCPWAIAVAVATKGAFFADSVKSDILPKLISGQESHGFPPGYYLLLMTVTFWPGSLYAWEALPRAWRHRADMGERYCLAWIVPTWLVFELIPTKLPHYVLPVYPALALLTAKVIMEGTTNAFRGTRLVMLRFSFVAWSVVSAVMTAGIVILPILTKHRFDPATIIPALTGLIMAVLPAWYAFRHKPKTAIITALICTPFIVGPTLQAVLPRIDSLWLSRSVLHCVERYRAEHPGVPPVIAAVGYHEPSLVFLLGTKTKLVNARKAAFYLKENPAALAVVSAKKDEAFRRCMAELKIHPTLVTTIEGFNYSKGRRTILKLYTVTPGRQKIP